ncbi:hypothetical protein ACQPV1_08650 [Clostridium neonatale]|uniref:hypothetical protein n=1 Tax=Clostridium neonatale TaxID=137838 RepID=UPI003D336BA9
MSNKQQLLKEFNLFLVECEMMGHSLLVNDAEYLQGDEVFILWDRYKDKIKKVIYNKNDVKIELIDKIRVMLNIM